MISQSADVYLYSAQMNLMFFGSFTWMDGFQSETTTAAAPVSAMVCRPHICRGQAGFQSLNKQPITAKTRST